MIFFKCKSDLSLICLKFFSGFSLLWKQKTTSFPGPVRCHPGLPLQLHLNPFLPHRTLATQGFFHSSITLNPFLLLGLCTSCSIFLEHSFPDVHLPDLYTSITSSSRCSPKCPFPGRLSSTSQLSASGRGCEQASPMKRKLQCYFTTRPGQLKSR